MTAAVPFAGVDKRECQIRPSALVFYGQQTTLNVIGITPGGHSQRNFLRTKRAVVLPITLSRCGKAYGDGQILLPRR